MKKVFGPPKKVKIEISAAGSRICSPSTQTAALLAAKKTKSNKTSQDIRTQKDDFCHKASTLEARTRNCIIFSSCLKGCERRIENSSNFGSIERAEQISIVFYRNK